MKDYKSKLTIEDLEAHIYSFINNNFGKEPKNIVLHYGDYNGLSDLIKKKTNLMGELKIFKGLKIIRTEDIEPNTVEVF